jgi:hypothetical protein
MQRKRKLRGKREGDVLGPCRLALDFTLSAGGSEPGESDTLPVNGTTAASSAALPVEEPVDRLAVNAHAGLCLCCSHRRGAGRY